MKYGGMSLPWGITFFSDNFEVYVTKNRTEIKKNKNVGKHIIYLILIIYLLLDVFINFGVYITNIISHILPKVQMPSLLPHLILPSWIGVSIVAGVYGFFLWFFIRVRGMHGAEHKAISASEKGNLSNLINANRINSRCGTNLLFPYLLFAGFFYLIGIKLIGTPLLISFLCLKKGIFARQILKIGALFQKATTKEPSKEQLSIAYKGMENILIAEEKHLMRQIKPFFVSIPQRT